MTTSTIDRTALAPLAARRRSLYLRVHGWAALIASPFILVATLTGLLYIFVPSLEGRLYAPLERVAPGAAMQPLDVAVAAARAAAPPGYRVRSVTPAAMPDVSVRVLLAPERAAGPHGQHHHAQGGPPLTVFVDPYRARVLGMQAADTRLSDKARNLHSRLLQGDGWRWMIELGASWLLVMLVTGIWLWWPRPGQSGLPRRGKTGRAAWRQWHAFAGVVLATLSLVIVVTGITWSEYAGGQVRKLRDAAGQASPRPPRDLHSTPRAHAPPLDWETAWRRVRAHAPATAVSLSAPEGAHGVWRATGIDRTRPRTRFELVLDAYSGQPLYRSGWNEDTAFGRATALGIPFHRGEFGLWNQLLLLAFGVGVLFSLLSGWVMVYKRWYKPVREPVQPLDKPLAGRGRAAAALLPPLLPGAWRAVSPVALAFAALLCALMPLLALSAAMVLLFEALRPRGGARVAPV